MNYPLSELNNEFLKLKREGKTNKQAYEILKEHEWDGRKLGAGAINNYVYNPKHRAVDLISISKDLQKANFLLNRINEKLNVLIPNAG